MTLPWEAHLGVESTNEIDNWCNLTEESDPPNRACGMARITPISIMLSGLTFRSCKSENLAAQRNPELVPLLNIGFLFYHSAPP